VKSTVFKPILHPSGPKSSAAALASYSGDWLPISRWRVPLERSSHARPDSGSMNIGSVIWVVNSCSCTFQAGFSSLFEIMSTYCIASALRLPGSVGRTGPPRVWANFSRSA